MDSLVSCFNFLLGQGHVFVERNWVLEFDEKPSDQFIPDVHTMLFGDQVVPKTHFIAKRLIFVGEGYSAHEHSPAFFVCVYYCLVPQVGHDVGLLPQQIQLSLEDLCSKTAINCKPFVVLVEFPPNSWVVAFHLAERGLLNWRHLMREDGLELYIHPYATVILRMFPLDHVAKCRISWLDAFDRLRRKDTVNWFGPIDMSVGGIVAVHRLRNDNVPHICFFKRNVLMFPVRTSSLASIISTMCSPLSFHWWIPVVRLSSIACLGSLLSCPNSRNLVRCWM
jgi:hypothetical protein